MVDIFSTVVPRIVFSRVRHGTRGVKRGLEEYLRFYLSVKPLGLHISISISPPLPPPSLFLSFLLLSLYLSLSCTCLRGSERKTVRQGGDVTDALLLTHTDIRTHTHTQDHARLYLLADAASSATQIKTNTHARQNTLMSAQN